MGMRWVGTCMLSGLWSRLAAGSPGDHGADLLRLCIPLVVQVLLYQTLRVLLSRTQTASP